MFPASPTVRIRGRRIIPLAESISLGYGPSVRQYGAEHRFGWSNVVLGPFSLLKLRPALLITGRVFMSSAMMSRWG
jgi:hypothetical protein